MNKLNCFDDLNSLFLKRILLIVLFMVSISFLFCVKSPANTVEYYDNLIRQALESHQADSTLAGLYLEAQEYIYITDINKAISYLHAAEKIYVRLNDKEHMVAVFYNLGHLNHQLQLYQIALKYLTQAHELQVELDDYTGAAYSNCDIGNVFFAFNQFSIAESYYRNSLESFRKHKDIYGMSVMNNNLGLCKMSLNQPDSALSYFNVGCNLRLKHKERFAIDHSINYLATAYAALHDYSRATAYYTKVINDIAGWTDAPQFALQLKADAQFNLWNLYQEQKDPYMANKYLDEALVSYNKINDTSGTIKTLLAMANDEYNQKEYSDAIQHGEAAYLLSDIKGLINTSQKVAGFLTKAYLQTGNLTNAQKYFILYSALSDSVISQYTSSELTQTHAAFQTYYTERENEGLKLREKLTIRYLIIIFILLLIALFLYFYVLVTRRSSIRNLKTLADATFEAIIIHDGGRIVEVNNQVCKMFGYTRNDLLNKNLADLPCLEMTEDFNKSIMENTDLTYEAKVNATDGFRADVEIISKPFKYNNKSVRVIAMRDITDRKHYIDELLKTNQQNKELIATKDKLFSIIAHDLKNPFNAIIGFSNYLKQDLDKIEKEELLELITMIYDTSLFAHDLLDNLLEWARVQTGRLQFHPQKLLLEEQFKPVLAVINSNAAVKQLSITVDIQADCLIYADPHMLRTILLNLLSNAIKFTNQAGMISVKGWKEARTTKIEISDNGIGIDPGIMVNLFKIDNMQSTKGTNNEPGTGLGLILCQELITKHSGHLDVNSVPGQGATFTISLPDER